jgi:hypothetical protein
MDCTIHRTPSRSAEMTLDLQSSASLRGTKPLGYVKRRLQFLALVTRTRQQESLSGATALSAQPLSSAHTVRTLNTLDALSQHQYPRILFLAENRELHFGKYSLRLLSWSFYM